ncbi:MAG: trigger factor family protein, partial [Candidatus Methylomirabilales bacterium]
MNTTVERESPTKLRLLVEVAPAEMAPFYEQTVRRLAQEIKVPGFRKGKVPRQVLETRIGKESIRQE